MNSKFTYACDNVQYKRKDVPDAWVTVGEAPLKMYRSYPVFEFVPGTKGDEEPLRFGDMVLDIDTGSTACKDAIKIISYMEEVYGVAPEQFRVWLSGKKGLHIELPAGVMGVKDGHKLLTIGFKRLCKDIEGELNVKLDLSMLNTGTGKPYRQPGIMRDTGTCKRQIEYSDLYEIITEEEYKAACLEPGPVWEPEDQSLNKLLADKLAAYLDEAVKNDLALRNRPSLSDDEIDRLAINKPPCIKMLANLVDNKGKGRTFNDIALQLTAYAVTAGASEADFIDGCGVFIAGYPSSSLNTLAKREQNCRARYRTMAANNNGHSCGGILALGFSGFDCSVCGNHKIITNDEWRSHAISAKVLRETEFPPIRWAVEKIIPEGLTILAGDPKSGKSLIAVDICSAVSSGSLAFGECACVQGHSIYFSFEDPQRRIKDRIRDQCDNWPHEFIIIDQGIPKLGDEFYLVMDSIVAEWPLTRIMIFDTLQLFVPPKKNGVSDYDHYYSILDPLHKWALDHHVAVVAITHKNKSKAQDGDNPFASIIGSVAIQSAADALIMLSKNYAKGSILDGSIPDGYLDVSGREVVAERHLLEFDTEALRWALKHKLAVEVEGGNPNWLLITSALKSRPMKPHEISAETKINRATVKSCLQRMAKKDLTVSNDGVWSLVGVNYVIGPGDGW